MNGANKMKNNHLTEMCCGAEAGSYLRLIDSCTTQLKAQGPSRTCNESKEEALAGGNAAGERSEPDEDSPPRAVLRYSQWTVPRMSGMESAHPPEQRYYVSSWSLSKKLWASRISSEVNTEVKDEALAHPDNLVLQTDLAWFGKSITC